MEFNGGMNLVFKLLLPVMLTMNFVLLPKMPCSAGGSYLKDLLLQRLLYEKIQL